MVLLYASVAFFWLVVVAIGYSFFTFKSANPRFMKLSPLATIPRKGTPKAAGYDLFPLRGFYKAVNPGESLQVPLGIASEFNDGYVAIVADRSGYGFKGLMRRAGIIDSDYRGEWSLMVVNTGKDIIYVDGDKAVCQVLFVPCCMETAREVSELSDTVRGEGAFGSTDRRK